MKKKYFMFLLAGLTLVGCSTSIDIETAHARALFIADRLANDKIETPTSYGAIVKASLSQNGNVLDTELESVYDFDNNYCYLNVSMNSVDGGTQTSNNQKMYLMIENNELIIATENGEEKQYTSQPIPEGEEHVLESYVDELFSETVDPLEVSQTYIGELINVYDVFSDTSDLGEEIPAGATLFFNIVNKSSGEGNLSMDLELKLDFKDVADEDYKGMKVDLKMDASYDEYLLTDYFCDYDISMPNEDETLQMHLIQSYEFDYNVKYEKIDLNDFEKVTE